MKLSTTAKVGAFLIIGFLVFAIGLFFIGNRQKLFSHNYDVYAEFERLGGLQKGANVRVSGMDAGEVTDMFVPQQPSGKYRLKIRIQKKFQSIVRADSIATIQTEGLVGNQFLDISKGTQNAPDAPEGSTLKAKEPVDWSSLVQQGMDLIKTTNDAVNDLRGNADKAIQAIGGAATDADGLILSARNDLKQITESSTRVVDNVNDLVTGIQNGRGAAGKLLRNEAVAKSVDDAVTNAREGSAHLNAASARLDRMATDLETRDVLGRAEAAIENTRQITDQLNQAVKSFLARNSAGEDAAESLRESIASARQSMANLADDTEALKHNFLFRGFFKKRGFYNLSQMTPAQYRESKFLTSNSRKRRWIPANELFSVQQDGAEALSPGAHSQIDEVMADFVSHLPNSPIMIEGYALGGSPADRFATARHRTWLISQYIEQRFGLDSKLIGTMPLTDPPSGTGKREWDGVSLVLLRD